MKFRDIKWLAVIGAVAAVLAYPAQAITVSGPVPTLTFSCTGLTYSAAGFLFQLDRDNTGNNTESYVSEIVDGAGNVLWQFTNTQSLGPPPFGAEVFGNAGTLAYTAPPAANPITYRLVSLAGNGLPQQTAFTASGHCASLPLPPAPTVAAVPTLGEWALMALSALLMLWGAGAAQTPRRRCPARRSGRFASRRPGQRCGARCSDHG